MTQVFISFASPSHRLAERLQDDLIKRGASVFQFNESAQAGRSAWDQVYDNIDQSDYFVLLLSHDAVKSRPVKKEIAYADHRNTNNDGWPELVPVLVEMPPLDAKKWPQALRVLTPLDLSDYESDPSRYESGVAKLVALMGIDEKVDKHKETDKVVDGRQTTKPAASAEIAVRFAGSPEQSVAPSNIKWSIEIENVGADNLQSARATLDKRKLGEPFSLAAGETKRFTKTSRYTVPRSNPRTLRVEAVGSDGTPIAVEQSASVKVTGSTADVVEVTDDQFRDRLEVKYSGLFSFLVAIGYSIFTLAIGAAAAIGAVPVAEFLLGRASEYLFVEQPAYLPGLLYRTLEWIGTAKWLHWTSGVLAAVCIAIYALISASDEVPVDAMDYAKITIISAFVAFLVSSVWALAHIAGFSIETLALVAGGAVALSSAVTGIFAFVEEFSL